MKNRFGIFIISCKQNTQVVTLLVESIQRHFSSPVEIFVSTDGDMPLLDRLNVSVVVSKGMTFGERMQDALAQVPYEQVIVMCDDFIVEAPVNEEELQALFNRMQKDATIASIALAQVSGENSTEKLFDHYVKRAEFGSYKTTLQCAVWKRSVLTTLMEGIKSPWEFELFANPKTYHTGWNFYALVSDEGMPIRYNRGKLIVRGHVVLPEKERLEHVLGHSIELSDFPETQSFDQGRGLSLWARLKRRSRLVATELYYRYGKRR